MNYSFESAPMNLQNLNVESINLNNSMRSDNSVNSSSHNVVEKLHGGSTLNGSANHIYKSLGFIDKNKY